MCLLYLSKFKPAKHECLSFSVHFIQLPYKDCSHVSLGDRQEEFENSEREKLLLQRLSVYSDARVQPIDFLTLHQA